MRKALLTLSLLPLAACVQQYKSPPASLSPQEVEQIVQGHIREYAKEHGCNSTINSDNECVGSSISSASSSTTSDSSVSQTTTVIASTPYVLRDDVKRMDRLKAMGAVKLQGEVSKATMHVNITRDNSTKGFGAIAMYFAPLTSDGNIDISREWTRFRYIDGTWKSNCSRHLAPSATFGLTQQEITRSFDASNIPVTHEDPCSTSQQYLDLISAINAYGAVVAFTPSQSGFLTEVILSHDGELNISDL